ncbi:ADP-ribosylation [Conidiobolus coronatus NRRL 28638]|uniref:Poly [ADP-ribose] polymerase n=1 Tax=Conidiobolus coronatus (strain ATCC 28846 / CBS 209.66 / NRRL 28638) TaxID=796925 RepID=A0A137NUY6_CONC2|nr:ADP-ribosylation [Conidiobolus coronatus NRRL 28638]|eukprot:KXN66566.1 ADP-ribosylation [Conidiobolus coronatus NRRL 28638]
MLKRLRLLNIGDNDIKIGFITRKDNDINRISSMYRNTNRNYINNRVKSVFKVQIGKFNIRFKSKANIIGNVQVVWHGTIKRNIVSILIRGLLLSITLTGRTNGGSYGSGICFSNSSSKSLRFCREWANISAMPTTTVYLVLASVAAGKYDTSGDYQ